MLFYGDVHGFLITILVYRNISVCWGREESEFFVSPFFLLLDFSFFQGGLWVITLADLHSNVEESPEWCSNSRRGNGGLKVTSQPVQGGGAVGRRDGHHGSIKADIMMHAKSKAGWGVRRVDLHRLLLEEGFKIQRQKKKNWPSVRGNQIKAK